MVFPGGEPMERPSVPACSAFTCWRSWVTAQTLESKKFGRCAFDFFWSCGAGSSWLVQRAWCARMVVF